MLQISQYLSRTNIKRAYRKPLHPLALWTLLCMPCCWRLSSMLLLTQLYRKITKLSPRMYNKCRMFLKPCMHQREMLGSLCWVMWH